MIYRILQTVFRLIAWIIAVFVIIIVLSKLLPIIGDIGNMIKNFFTRITQTLTLLINKL